MSTRHHPGDHTPPEEASAARNGAGWTSPADPPVESSGAVPGVADPAAIGRRVEELFVASGALREGHFLLKSGRHAGRYVEKFQVLQYPESVSELCRFLADKVHDPAGPLVDVVVGPTTGGVILAFEVARQLGVRGIFAEEVRDPDGTTRREFRRGFRLSPGERVLLVDDILTTGGSLLAMLPPIEASGAELALAAVLVDRSGGLSSVTSPVSGHAYPATALWTLDLPTYEAGPATCPACAAGLPIEAPGSTGTKRGATTGPIVEGTPSPGPGMPPGPQAEPGGVTPTALGPAT
jgi:orotate phosphoribosyltransferase